jgi:hypothetical protein
MVVNVFETKNLVFTDLVVQARWRGRRVRWRAPKWPCGGRRIVPWRAARWRRRLPCGKTRRPRDLLPVQLQIQLAAELRIWPNSESR